MPHRKEKLGTSQAVASHAIESAVASFFLHFLSGILTSHPVRTLGEAQ